jgi:CubicO group peptidase (beta-lactamase class C family)
VFSVTKGLAAMALNLLADRARLDWDAPVSTYWAGFGRDGKEGMSLRTLFNHRGGLLALTEPLTMDDCLLPARADRLLGALERQRPAWSPGASQGYHAVTFGMYAREVFERIAGETLGTFLRRELFDPLDSDVRLGTPPEDDAAVATLYPPPVSQRVMGMLTAAIHGDSTEARVARQLVARDSPVRGAFGNPRVGLAGMASYNEVPVRRAELAWASATATARGLSRAYLPFASGGVAGGRTYLRAATLSPVHERQSWSERDLVLQKPIGWSQGFLKEETHLFSPHRESFGHAGMGGALGWCDPVSETTFGYVMNRLDWRVRSPRAIALCRALYDCEPLRK